MSGGYYMYNNFNPTLLSEMILTAIGNRTHISFSKDTGINPSHLSRIINNKLPYPPRKSTLIQIANHSEGRITAEMLFDACGYETLAPEKTTLLPMANKEAAHKLMEAAILSALAKTAFPCSFIRSSERFFDLSLQLGTEPNIIWKFIFLSAASLESNEATFNSAITSLVFMESISDKIKFSFVTAHSNSFKHFSDKSSKYLNMDVSFILIDPNSLLITNENWISRSWPLKAYMEKFNILKIQKAK